MCYAARVLAEVGAGVDQIDIIFNPTFPRWSRKHRQDDSSTLRYHDIGIEIHFTPGVHAVFLLGERIGAGFSGYDDAAMRPGVNFPLDLKSGN